MKLTPAERTFPPLPTAHRWTVNDFLRADEAGLFEGQRVELIDGELIDMPVRNDLHAFAVSRLVHGLQRLFPDPYWVKIQSTQRLNDFSAPEPDVAVLSGPPSPPALSIPTPLLVVEVSDTTLAYNLGNKASLYAANGITDYWVADVNAQQVEVFRNPIRDTSKRHGWQYQPFGVFRLGDHVQPLAKPKASLDVAEFLG